MANNKLTKEEIQEAALKVAEYEIKLKMLQEEYSEYRKIFRLRGKSSIESEWDLQGPIRQKLQCSKNEAEKIAKEVFNDLLLRNEDLAMKYINKTTFNYKTKSYIRNEYRNICFKCLLNNPDKIMKLLDGHSYNYENQSDYYFNFTSDELNLVWEKYGEYYLKKVSNTVIDFYTLFLCFSDRFNYDDKALLVKRIMGRNKERRALDLIKHPNIPQDLKDQLEAYLLMQKLK